MLFIKGVAQFDGHDQLTAQGIELLDTATNATTRLEYVEDARPLVSLRTSREAGKGDYGGVPD